MAMAAWSLIREDFLQRYRSLLSSPIPEDLAEEDKLVRIFYHQVVYLLDFAVPLIREMDYCLSHDSPDKAQRFQQCKEPALLLQLMICNPTRSKYAVPALLEFQYRLMLQRVGGSIKEVDDFFIQHPSLLSSERLEILIGIAASGNGMNHITSTEDAYRKWTSTLLSSTMSSSMRSTDTRAGKWHNCFTRNSLGVLKAIEEFDRLAGVRA